MNINFNGKRALVTGAGKGIGKAVAIRLAECGAEVIAVSRTQSDLDELSKISNKIKGLLLDVGKWDATYSAIQNVGPVDLLVNNAGVADLGAFGDVTENVMDRTYDINVKAIVNITQILAKGMKERGTGGSIVNISSVASFQGAPELGLYASSKGAVDQLTRCMAIEYGPDKIRVNAVNPTFIYTRMAEKFQEEQKGLAEMLVARTPMRRLGEVDDVAYPVLFLLSDKASLITGATLPIDGGLSICF